MPYYEYEFLLEDIKEYVEKENKKNKEDEKKYDAKSMMSGMKSTMNSISNGNFKAPKVPKI